MIHTEKHEAADSARPDPSFAVINAADGLRQKMLAEVVTGTLIGNRLQPNPSGDAYLRLTTVDPESDQAVDVLIDAAAARQLAVQIDALLRRSSPAR